MRENRYLEFKSSVSNTFLKTVSAFSNFGTGEIKFGVLDDGSVCGVTEPGTVCLDIENRINDSISPKPDFLLSVDQRNGVITLKVFEGKYKPYLYKGKAYRRSDTASIEVDQLELKRLTLEGSNLYYEGLPCGIEHLEFSFLEVKVREKLGISQVTDDILRTFGFMTDKREWNNAAALFADQNRFSGIDIARFGDSINVIMDRELLSGISILEQYDRAVALYRKYYQYEEITGIERVKKEIVPEEAFREAVANALVHRTWDINSNIRISMFPDRIEISSPGGLPKGITREEYLNGSISNLRNPIIGNVFFRMRYIEMFGTGIRRILESYKKYTLQPVFQVTDNSITVILPIFKESVVLSADEKKLMELLHGGRMFSSREAAEALGWGKDKVLRIMKKLAANNQVRSVGTGRSTRYLLK